MYILSQLKWEEISLKPEQTKINLIEWSARLKLLFNPPTFPLIEDAFHISSVLPKFWVKRLVVIAASALQEPKALRCPVMKIGEEREF